jgi:TPR repeat protein
MTKSRVTIVVLALLIAAGTAAYWLVARIDSEAKAVDNGVVEFKRGNYESAVRILSPYADRGNQAAQLNLGLAYAFGQGVSKDRDRARQLLKSALGAKSAEMYAWIAKSFEMGDGVAKDPTEATAWYHIAAEAGSSEAQEWLQRQALPSPRPNTSPG